MRYISDDIDNKVRSLKGRFSYADLLRETRDLLFGYSKDEALNFVRQSVYRLKKDKSIVAVKRGLFEINTNFVKEVKINLSILMTRKEVSRDTDELAFENGLTNQMVNKKTYIVSDFLKDKFENDMHAVIKYTRHILNKENLEDFELARLSLFFDLNSTSDTNTFVRVLKQKGYMDSNKIMSLSKYLHPRYKKQIEALANKVELFQKEGFQKWA